MLEPLQRIGIPAEILTTVLDNVGAYVYIKDTKGRYIYVNRQVQELFGVPLEKIVGQTDEAFFDLERSAELRENDRHVMESGQVHETEEVNYLKSTGKRHIYLTVKQPLFDDRKKLIGMFGVSTDITEIFLLQERLREQSNRDPMTGLYNRRFFFDFAEKNMAESERSGRPTATLIIDVDDFKNINDAHGHPAGDHVLKVFSAQLEKLIRKGDIAARVGGEEFAVLLPNTGHKQAVDVAHRICEQTRINPIKLPDGDVARITVSIGVADSLDSKGPYEKIYAKADSRLYVAKQNGRDQLCADDNAA